MQVTRVSQRTVSRAPPPPFTTASLQQAASSQLGFAPSQTMSLAQQLYEGPEDGAPAAVSLATHTVLYGQRLARK